VFISIFLVKSFRFLRIQIKALLSDADEADQVLAIPCPFLLVTVHFADVALRRGRENATGHAGDHMTHTGHHLT